MSTEQEPARPADTLRDGNLKATIWQNHGQNGAYYTTSFARTYEDRNGDLKDTNSFSGTDLLRVAELARDAYARSNELRREQSHTQDRNVAPRQKSQAQDDYDDPNDEGASRHQRQNAFRERRNGRGNSNGRSRQSQDRGGSRANLPDHDL